jgi:hypothetical protein
MVAESREHVVDSIDGLGKGKADGRIAHPTQGLGHSRAYPAYRCTQTPRSAELPQAIFGPIVTKHRRDKNASADHDCAQYEQGRYRNPRLNRLVNVVHSVDADVLDLVCGVLKPFNL